MNPKEISDFLRYRKKHKNCEYCNYYRTTIPHCDVCAPYNTCWLSDNIIHFPKVKGLFCKYYDVKQFDKN